MSEGIVLPPVEINKVHKGWWVPKGWGGAHVIVNKESRGYCAKRLFIFAGKCFSYHYHEVKHETLYIVSGRGCLLYAPNDDEARFRGMLENATVRELVVGDVITIPPSTPHRIAATEDMWIFETSTYDNPRDFIRLVKGD